MLLFFSREIGLVNGEFPAVTMSDVEFPQKGSRIVFAMAFLGVYLSGLQHIYRRYAASDLSPTLYYGFSMRVIYAAVVAMVIFNAFSALSGGEGSGGGITAPTSGRRWPS